MEPNIQSGDENGPEALEASTDLCSQAECKVLEVLIKNLDVLSPISFRSQLSGSTRGLWEKELRSGRTRQEQQPDIRSGKSRSGPRLEMVMGVRNSPRKWSTGMERRGANPNAGVTAMPLQDGSWWYGSHGKSGWAFLKKNVSFQLLDNSSNQQQKSHKTQSAKFLNSALSQALGVLIRLCSGPPTAN